MNGKPISGAALARRATGSLRLAGDGSGRQNAGQRDSGQGDAEFEPPRRRHKPLIRSAGVRFAVVYAIIFGLSAFALAFSIWYSTVGLLQRQVQIAIRNDATALSDHFTIGGLPSLIAAINDRITENVDGDAIYLLVDPQGNRIAGNLGVWPDGLDQTSDWYEAQVARRGAGSVALLRVWTLPGGFELLVGRDVTSRTQLRHLLRDGLLWAMAIMTALGLLGAVVIRSMFRRMIQDISNTTRAISRGDLSRRVNISGNGDEFDELADNINDMLDRIARLMDGVRQVSNSIAHDLRTPITRARARLEDAALHAHTPEDLRSAIERATIDLDAIIAVFQALLRIAEIEAGSRRSAFAELDLVPLLEEIDELYRDVAEERGLRLETHIAPGPLPLWGDRELMQQAITNLLDNALKFSAPGTTISFTSKAEDAMILIAVGDRGPGISIEDRERATERFFRAESARNTPGSGLGLALVAAVAQVHNGTLRLQDNHPGLRAVITCPAAGLPKTDPRIARVRAEARKDIRK
jgi:signal transduction histidine kinase